MSQNFNQDYLTFWGKARPHEGAAHQWHPAAYHNLDVAAVADVLQRERRNGLSRMADHIDIPIDELIKLNTFLIALHDLGKFSRSFQSLAPKHWPKILSAKPEDCLPAPHWQLSSAMLCEPNGMIQTRLKESLGLDYLDGLNPLIAAVAGHHGRPPEAEFDLSKKMLCENCAQAASDYLDDLLKLIPPPKVPRLEEKAAKLLSHWLSGLTVASDWLGSNQTIFKYHAEKLSLNEYWQTKAKPRAKQAIKNSGLSPSSPATNATLHSLFGINMPRPMQAAISNLSLPAGPTLVVIEDATGSGKTEAATLLAQRMMVAGNAGGLYFALPTMATANAMFERMEESYLKLFAIGNAPSLALAHGRRELSEKFKQVKLAAFDEPASLNGEDKETAAQCAQWIADDRRKTFFAQVGVGTIDQALLSVLPSKFQSLRLWGLIDRILIVDEAHAYDAYMSRELETLLEFHAALGGSAIILSATLPAAKRESLANAFQTGLGIKKPTYEAQSNAPYPLVTVAFRDTVEEITSIPPASHTVRKVHAERLSDVANVVDKIVKAQSKGAAVAWVRNAVDDAIEAVELLRERGVDADLFHARFAMGDRLEIETNAVARFGYKGCKVGRKGRVLVATQVIEQSLDLDFDLMVSDLAPIDLLIQRAGRLWRHMDIRPAVKRPVDGPKLLVLSPDPAKVEDEKWLDNLGHKGAFVYKNHALLWRTAKVLFERGGFAVPRDLRPMIEAVYGDPAEMETPEILSPKDIDAEGQTWGDRTTASFNLLRLKDGYARSGSWLEENAVKTRLGETQRTIRLARLDGERIKPYCDIDADDDRRAWALSEVSVHENWLKGADVSVQWRKVIDSERATWPKWQRDILIAPVDKDGTLLLDWPRGAEGSLIYTNKNGLEQV